MQGRSGSDRELLDTASLVGHLVPAGSVFAFLAEHRDRVFPDGMFADLFPSGKGRPSVPGAVIASVLVLQALHDLSDAEAMQALRCDLRWKVACGPKGRCRQLRYRGVAANDWWLHTRMAALNLRRLLNLGLTANSTGWAIS